MDEVLQNLIGGIIELAYYAVKAAGWAAAALLLVLASALSLGLAALILALVYLALALLRAA